MSFFGVVCPLQHMGIGVAHEQLGEGGGEQSQFHGLHGLADQQV